MFSSQLRNRLNLLWSYVAKKSYVPGGPLTLAIESTAKCSLSCPMYIHCDGTVFPCCYIYPEEAVGNVKRSSLKEIWNSGKMVRLREAHIRRDMSQYKACRNCPAARPKLAVTLGSFLINTHTVRKAIPFFERMAQIQSISVFETLK